MIIRKMKIPEFCFCVIKKNKISGSMCAEKDWEEPENLRQLENVARTKKIKTDVDINNIKIIGYLNFNEEKVFLGKVCD